MTIPVPRFHSTTVTFVIIVSKQQPMLKVIHAIIKTTSCVELAAISHATVPKKIKINK